MSLTLKQLKVFVAVAQERTITQAADRLCLTKPAVSMALSELEKQLGHPLFDRHSNRLHLNDQGHQLLPLADEFLSRGEVIERLFRQSGALNGALHLGCSDTVGNQVAPFLLRDFRLATGHKEQGLFISNTQHICQMLVQFELDLALVEGQVQHKDLISEPWLGDDMVVIAAPNHPLAGKPSPTLRDLKKQEWVLREEGSGTREYFLQHLTPAIRQWQSSFELNTTEAIINCVAAGLGLSCLSRRAIQRAADEGRVKVLPIALEAERNYWILYHKRKYQSPLFQSFLQFCHQWSGPQT